MDSTQIPQESFTVFLTATLYSDELMEALTGDTAKNKEEAVLPGYDLVIQGMAQVPPIVQDIIRGSGWDDDFETYNLAPGDGSIKGVKCTVTRDQWERLKDWDIVPDWFVEKNVEIENVKTGKRETVLSIVMAEGQTYDRKVDGHNFDPFLMPQEKVLEAARRVRRLYDERIGATSPEGSISRKEL